MKPVRAPRLDMDNARLTDKATWHIRALLSIHDPNDPDDELGAFTGLAAHEAALLMLSLAHSDPQQFAALLRDFAEWLQEWPTSVEPDCTRDTQGLINALDAPARNPPQYAPGGGRT